MIDRRRTIPSGFTVVELIVALSISAITLLSGYELFQSLRGVADRQNADRAVMVEVVHGLHRLRDDLLHALPRAEAQEPIFIGANPSLEDNAEATLLDFYALGAGPAGAGGFDLRQMQRIRYEVVKAEDALGLYRHAAQLGGADQAFDADAGELVLEGIERIEIAFHNGQSVETQFSSNETLPVGVDLIVAARGQVWPLSVKLPCGFPEGRQ